jgi:nicotinamide mononucleotide adenylyltransferase
MSVHYSYFIGRLNPPHSGHIMALFRLIELARSQESRPLILLGSGPKKLRTMDNPIPFELKKAFIERKLARMGVDPSEYILEEMGSPASDVSRYVYEGMNSLSEEQRASLSQVVITHIAGDKDEDASKLNFIKEGLKKTAQTLAPNAKIVTNTESIPAEPVHGVSAKIAAMSATKVRKAAYNCFLRTERNIDAGISCFGEEYGEFYDELTPDIFREIIEPVLETPDDDILFYIENGEIRKPAKSSTKRKAASAGLSTGKGKRRTKKYKKSIRRKHRGNIFKSSHKKIGYLKRRKTRHR